ncbi:PTS glucitol/sorbitol transporter subunit IIB [Alicyclobacillus cycloheptanicus]|uniref:PTS system glucitol/sorbitol-specific IIC component n=1 Tax=Alicyclobacillus cycloheptanicus TaxID=1457 RepID=A0ABT9XLK7_9BACL|nr:PTS glucitol/sorbitol transporter subunit IIB [Alicyclobacillus cycloheptanicus]MDQ0191199.1 PTS system glucitol/sorbitol-specific IIC component [Alicyclobacillus cycloheptanicus]WDM02113.1 PTS glucitol/sorbitol transporter subunit IIB [Alicyclobacillus cycloheptanicus]
MGQAVRIEKGSGGWGTGLVVAPEGKRTKVVSVTGGGIHPVAQRIAELSGAQAVDGFSTAVPEDEMMCVVIDCGGTARIGVYPMKRIPTVDVLPSSPSGPLSKFIKEDIFVSGVTVRNIVLADKGEARTEAGPQPAQKSDNPFQAPQPQVSGGNSNWLMVISRGIGKVIGTLYQAGRDSVDMLLKNIIPFMAFVSMLVGIINYTGLGKLLAHGLVPLAGSLGGLIVLVIVCTLPFLSPVLGPGAVIAQIIGVLVGTQIATKAISPVYALPALFAIDGQVGCDFVPVGLSLGEAKPETIEYGVPAVLYSRLITGVVAVLLGYVASLGMYS